MDPVELQGLATSRSTDFAWTVFEEALAYRLDPCTSPRSSGSAKPPRSAAGCRYPGGRCTRSSTPTGCVRRCTPNGVLGADRLASPITSRGLEGPHPAVATVQSSAADSQAAHRLAPHGCERESPALHRSLAERRCRQSRGRRRGDTASPQVRGALGGIRTPNLLIRSRRQRVRACRFRAADRRDVGVEVRLRSPPCAHVAVMAAVSNMGSSPASKSSASSSETSSSLAMISG